MSVATASVTGTTTITVVTATYNRRHCLQRLCESLRAQTFKHFDWLIVDDGSTDGTRELVAAWAESASFPMTYVQQTNQGKHAALNRAAERARGDFCAVIDSDDWYAPNALERLLFHWAAIPDPEKPAFANVESLCAYADGRLVGMAFPRDVLDSDAFEIRHAYHVVGDTVGMYRTSVLREFPFPENVGRFVPESLVWNRIGSHYRGRYVNEVLGYKEYLAGGLSDRSLHEHVESSAAYAMFFRELAATARPLPLASRLRAYANYARFALHQGHGIERQRREVAAPWLWCLAVPVGLAVYLRDRRLLAGSAR